MGTTERTLLVLRHSKSAYPEGTADFDRPLAPRGLRDAVTLGIWIRDQGLQPDLVGLLGRGPRPADLGPGQ